MGNSLLFQEALLLAPGTSFTPSFPPSQYSALGLWLYHMGRGLSCGMLCCFTLLSLPLLPGQESKAQ